MKKEIIEFQKIIGYSFKDQRLLKEALTHTSYSNEYRKTEGKDNERLEFLGDSVLGLIISKHLFHQKKNFPEGVLTKTRAGIVCEDALKDIASDIKLGQFMLLGKGEIANGGRNRASILADGMEALIAAIFLDGGLEEASSFVLERMKGKIEESVSGKIKQDYKTQLQEILQRDFKEPIIYRLDKEKGPDHDKIFTMSVFLGNRLIGTGIGKSKKEAEQHAAKDAMEKGKYE